MLSQTLGYAITALGYIARKAKGPMLVRDVAMATGIPSAYLSKIINMLGKRGVVRTQRGIRGGVTLARAAKDITLFELCVALDDPISSPRCMLGIARCADETACPAHEFWLQHRAKYLEFLRNTTLEHVAQFENYHLR